MNLRNSRSDKWMLVILLVLSSLVTAFGSLTMALGDKDRKIAEMQRWTSTLEAKNREFLASILACTSGGGYTVEFTTDTSTKVKCTIEHQWVKGKFISYDRYEKKTK